MTFSVEVWGLCVKGAGVLFLLGIDMEAKNAGGHASFVGGVFGSSGYRGNASLLCGWLWKQ